MSKQETEAFFLGAIRRLLRSRESVPLRSLEWSSTLGCLRVVSRAPAEARAREDEILGAIAGLVRGYRDEKAKSLQAAKDEDRSALDRYIRDVVKRADALERLLRKRPTSKPEPWPATPNGTWDQAFHFERLQLAEGLQSFRVWLEWTGMPRKRRRGGQADDQRCYLEDCLAVTLAQFAIPVTKSYNGTFAEILRLIRSELGLPDGDIMKSVRRSADCLPMNLRHRVRVSKGQVTRIG